MTNRCADLGVYVLEISQDYYNLNGPFRSKTVRQSYLRLAKDWQNRAPHTAPQSGTEYVSW